MNGRALLFTLITLTLGGGMARAGTAAGRGPEQVLRLASARGPGPVRLDERAVRAGPVHVAAPYLAVAGGGEQERLPLEETRADVSVAGTIAQVKVTQVFRNRGARPIEAIYVFPASTRAAVHGMRLKIGERVVEARIERRARARADYEAARDDGKRAALLEEERPNVFTMHVANVMPGDRIVAELDYSELIVPEEGVYELVYPAVVGPRYAGGAEPARDGWVRNPHLHEGEDAPYRFGFGAHLESALPVKELSSPSHRLDVAWRSPRSADVKLGEAGGGDRDVVLRWRLAGDAIEAGALVFPDDAGGGYFLATVEPPARVAPDLVPPREYVFVLDVSGSMHGFPLDTAKALMRSLLPKLRPSDSFNVVFFSGASFVLSPSGSLPATPDNVRRALDTFAAQRGGGGTELLQALRIAYDLPRADRRVARSVVVVTDGYVVVEAGAFRLVRERLDEASCFAFGIGSSVNRALIEALARAGQGEATVVDAPGAARAAADRLERIVSAPLLSQLRYRFDGLDARDVAPGKLPDLLAERPVVLLGRYRGAPKGRIVVEGQGARGRFEKVIDLGAASTPAGGPLRVLWARRWVELLMDEHHLGAAPEIEDAVTDLGLAHRILTPFTSFVAIDSEVVNRGGHGASVAQPLPLPQGVSDLAVGEGGLAREAKALPFRSPGRAAEAPRGAVAQEALADRAMRKSASAPAPGPSFASAAAPAVPSPEAPPAASPVTFLREEATGVRDAAALREAVRAALARAAAEGVRGAIEVRITLDAGGGPAKVEVLSAPDAAARAAVLRALSAIGGGARPAGAAPGVYRFSARLG